MKTRILLGGWLFCFCLALVRAEDGPVWRKLEEWKVPSVSFENTELGDAVDWVRAKSREIDPVGKGRKAGLLLGYERRRNLEPDRLLNLTAEDITLGDLLTEIGKQANRTVEIHEDGVVLRVPGAIPVIEGMAEQTYRVPIGFFAYVDRSDDQEVDPFGNGEAEPRPRFSIRAAREILEGYGITFAEGASARHVNGSTGELLVVRNTPDQLELIEALFDSIKDGGYLPQVRILAEIYSMDTGAALTFARDADNPAGAALLLRDLADKVAIGEAELVGCPMVLTRHANRASAINGSSREIITGYVAKDGKDVATTERLLTGASMEVDPVIGADGYHIELEVAIDVGIGEPKVTRTEMLAPVSGERVPVESVESNGVKIHSSIITISGQPQFLGVTPANPGTGKSVLAFVTVWKLDVRYQFPVPE